MTTNGSRHSRSKKNAQASKVSPAASGGAKGAALPPLFDGAEGRDAQVLLRRLHGGLLLHSVLGVERLGRCADVLRSLGWTEERIADLGLHGACPTARFEDRRTEELFYEYKKTGDPNLRNALLECFYPMVRHVSASLLRRFPRCVDLEELSSAGIHGLYRALEAYDPERGGTFKTYCASRIKGAILDELRSQDWVPRAVRVKAQRFDRAREELIGAFGREPTNPELAEYLGLALSDFQDESKEAVTYSMKNFTDGEVESDETDGAEPFSELVHEDIDLRPGRRLEVEDGFHKVLEGLTDKERLILQLYYKEELKMREIGDRLNITESRVCQIHSNLMERLRKRLKHKVDEI